MSRARMEGIAPFFIVKDVVQSSAFYRDKLGFEITFLGPEGDPFFAIVLRDQAEILMKAVEQPPLPNPKYDPGARWDAFVYVPDPDALAAEFAERGVEFTEPLKDTHDGLRGFEIKDLDGYVLFLGRTIG